MSGSESANPVAPGVSGCRRDPFEVLGIPKDAKDDQIKSAYKKLALKFHPDKNGNSPEAEEKFKEINFSYSILIDAEKRRQYEQKGFDGLDLEAMDDSLDLSSLGAFNTAMVALFSKLGVPVKTSVSANVLESAMNGAATIRPLPLGRPVSDKVDKQAAHFFGCTLSEEQARGGVVVRVVSGPTSKFKLLYFEQDSAGGLNLLMQENSVKSGKGTTAGFYFLGFQTYRLDPTVSPMEVASDPEAVLFRKLDSLQPTEIREIKGGLHIVAVYGDNFFKSASYTIEVVGVEGESEIKSALKEVEGRLVTKQQDLRKFEVEFREAWKRFVEVESRLRQEKVLVEELISERYRVQENFSGGSKNSKSSSTGNLSSPLTPPPKSNSQNSQNAENDGKKKETVSQETGPSPSSSPSPSPSPSPSGGGGGGKGGGGNSFVSCLSGEGDSSPPSVSEENDKKKEEIDKNDEKDADLEKKSDKNDKKKWFNFNLSTKSPKQSL